MSSSGSEDEVVERVSKGRNAAPQPRKRNAPKPKKDPTKPKRGLSPYFCFMREERPSLVASRPGLKIGEVAKVLAAKWNQLGAADREKFVKFADEDKDRYLEEMKVWEAAQRGVNLKASKTAPAPAKKAKKPAQEEEDQEDEEEEEEDEDSE